MFGMQCLLSTLIVIFALVLFVRAAAVALEMTGLDTRTALFQALSAFSGTGFTTRESESIMNHPVRRKIAILLMVLGTAGFATVIITSTSHIVTREDYWLPIDALILVVGLYLNWIPLPKAEERIQEGDRIVVYGPLEVARDLFKKGGVSTNEAKIREGC